MSEENNIINERIDGVMSYIRFRADKSDDRIYNIENHLNILRFWTLGSVIVAMLAVLFAILTVGGK